MREKKNFAERTTVLLSDETKRKYFLVYEGSDTEDIYFEGIINNKVDIGIDPLIELIPLVRSYSEEGWSNPKKIVDRVIDDLEQAKTGTISYEALLNCIMEYLQEEAEITISKKQATDIWKLLQNICTDKLSQFLNYDVEDIEVACNEIVKYLKQSMNIEFALEDISKVIEEKNIPYSEGFDKICFIFDRDKNSFLSKSKDNQYEYVLKKCLEKGFGLYISNPCFEFWLLLHFEHIKDLDKAKLLENKKVNASGETYAEKELKSVFKEYKKSKYNPQIFMSNIDQAIENEKLFCEDIEELECQVGCNIGLLIQELIGKKR